MTAPRATSKLAYASVAAEPRIGPVLMATRRLRSRERRPWPQRRSGGPLCDHCHCQAIHFVRTLNCQLSRSPNSVRAVAVSKDRLSGPYRAASAFNPMARVSAGSATNLPFSRVKKPNPPSSSHLDQPMLCRANAEQRSLCH